MIHYFKNEATKGDVQIGENELPSKFTYPFHYTPHPLVVRASEEVNAYLSTRIEWQEELSHGKMFGVLLIKTPEGKVGYLAGFSGNLAGSNHHDFFVPPVFDLLRPGDFFKVEEAHISAINHRIAEVVSSPAYKELKEEVRRVHEEADAELKAARVSLKEAKKRRDAERKSISEGQFPKDEARLQALVSESQFPKDEARLQALVSESQFPKDEARLQVPVSEGQFPKDEARLQALVSESQFQKAEFKRLERRLKEAVAEKDAELKAVEDEITRLKQERKSRSAALQWKLFEHFRMLNALGEVKDLCQIFEETRHSVPPAGAGECALPKLLQYAYLHKLRPLAFGEFWWGESPKDEIRRHGQFYPSCKGKCEPILQHMLVGLEVEANPLADDVFRDVPLRVLYEDEWLVVVEKPAGMLSTPGKEAVDSVSERLHRMFPEATGPLLVHRLDMATSGLLLAAKTKEVHALLQGLFEAREVRKIYTAVLDGVPAEREGCVSLPLCLNPMDRPRQMVSFELGKEAVTFFRVLAVKDGRSLVEFDLKTGRTHQIRVHAAHPLGLNCPIKGDGLYGKAADRLYLHATEVEFVHPVTGRKIVVRSEVPFGG